MLHSLQLINFYCTTAQEFSFFYPALMLFMIFANIILKYKHIFVPDKKKRHFSIISSKFMFENNHEQQNRIKDRWKIVISPIIKALLKLLLKV